MNNKIVKVVFNNELPTKYDYKHFDAILEDGEIKTFYYHINNPIPMKEEMIGLTWDELCNFCKKLFDDEIKKVL